MAEAGARRPFFRRARPARSRVRMRRRSTTSDSKLLMRYVSERRAKICRDASPPCPHQEAAELARAISARFPRPLALSSFA